MAKCVDKNINTIRRNAKTKSVLQSKIAQWSILIIHLISSEQDIKLREGITNGIYKQLRRAFLNIPRLPLKSYSKLRGCSPNLNQGGYAHVVSNFLKTLFGKLVYKISIPNSAAPLRLPSEIPFRRQRKGRRVYHFTTLDTKGRNAN